MNAARGTRIRRAGGALALALAFGCTTVGRDHEPPQASVPAAWSEDASPAIAAEPADLAAWWRRLEDPVLDALVERAAQGSLDVRESLARLRESRALRGVAAADRYPTVALGARYERSRASDTTAFGQFASLGDVDLHAAGVDAAWEVDLWGRVRRSVEAAEADLEATVEDVRGVAVSLAGETALQYVRVREHQRRLEIARTNVELQEETLGLARTRFEAGLVGERDVAQAATQVESTRALVPAIEIELRAAENRLATLLGLAPGALARELAEPRPIPVAPATIAVGVPADLLRRRPDVRRAERELAAETARIGVAEGDLYPRLSLTGSFGYQSEEAEDFLDSGSRTYGIGPSIRWSLFEGGRLRDRVEAQDARAEQALVRWERAVLGALEETENAMTAFVREQRRRESLAQAEEQARKAVELARTQYREGLSDFQPVLDSQRELAALEDVRARSDAAITTSLVALYKALGGGWEAPSEPTAAIP